jgi:3-deoxy-D-manno-octulosonic-acid transferase
VLGRWVYALIALLAVPVVLLRLWWRGQREPDYQARRAERLGRVPPGIVPGPVWFHAASAGETIAVAPLIRKLRADFPALPFLVTTMTPTGSEQVRRLLGDAVLHCYAPYDFGFAVRRFLDRVQPRLLVLVETELWPNLISMTAARAVPVVAINARLSERSARGYAHISWLSGPMIARLTWVACQTPEHAARFRRLGVPDDRVVAMGTVKFDHELPADHAQRVAVLRDRWALAGRPVWIAASTHPGEDERVLEAHRAVRIAVPGALLLLVPRHPSRSRAVAQIVREAGFSVRPLSEARGPAGDVLLGDTMGDLLYLYGLAQVAFVGGSLVAAGGHNPIEPALCGLPLLAGRHQYNFVDVSERFRAAGALTIVHDPADLARCVIALLRDETQRAAAGTAAREVVMKNRGATERLRDRLHAEIAAR